MTVRVYLGWCRLLDTDQAGVDALRTLCAALGIRTYLAPEESTLVLESPVQDRRVVLDSSGCAPAPLIGQAAARLAEHLRATGATVTLVPGSPATDGREPAAPPDLFLALGADPRLPGPRATFSTGAPSRSRLLGRMLVESVAAATGLPAAGVRFSWPRGEAACLGRGLDAPAVLLTLPDPAGGPEPCSAQALAYGMWEGIMRFCAGPDLTELIGRLGERPRPDAALLPAPPMAGGQVDAPAPAPAGSPPADPGRGAATAPPSPRPAADPFRPPGARQVFVFQVQPDGRPAFVGRPGPRPPVIPRPNPQQPARPGGTFPPRPGQSVSLGDSIRVRSHWLRSDR